MTCAPMAAAPMPALRLKREGDRLIARSTGIQSSGALMSMVLADGLAVMPEEVRRIPAGDEIEVLPLRPIE